MREEDIETAIKVVVVGNGAVGKSSMIQRYCKGIFTQEYKKTIGVDFLERQIEVNGEDVRLMLWDTAGQEEFDAITKAYYRGAQACVLVFSTVDRDSYKAVESWKKKVENECGHIIMVLIQNKIDLIDQAVIAKEESEELAKRLRVRFYRASVKDDLNISEVFRYLAEQYLKQLSEPIEDIPVRPPPEQIIHYWLCPILNSVSLLKTYQSDHHQNTWITVFQMGVHSSDNEKVAHSNPIWNAFNPISKTSQESKNKPLPNNGTISLHQNHPKRTKSGKRSTIKSCNLL